MSGLKNSDTFCIFCYKTVNCSEQTKSNLDAVKNFIKILGRFVGRNVSDLLLLEQGLYGNLSALLFKCCKNCIKLTDNFCYLYQKLKLLELQLDFKLNELVRKLEHANKLPTRWIHLNKVLNDSFPNDLVKRKQSQNGIREFRQSVVQAAHQRFLQCQPRVLLKRSNIFQSTVQQSNINNQDNLTFSDQDDLIDYDEDTFNDPEADTCENKYAVGIRGSLKVLDRSNDTKVGIKRYHFFKQRQFTSPCDIDTNPDTDIPNESRVVTEKAGKIRSLKGKVGRPKSKGKRDRKRNTQNNKCDICGRKLSSTGALKVHLEYHKDPAEWQHKCGECGKKFATKYDLIMHSRKHTKEQPYVCQICGEKYGYKISLRKHLIKKHGNDSAEDNNESNGELTIINGKYGKPQNSNKVVRKLIQKSLRKGGNPCPKCGKRLSSDVTLRVHLEYHKNPEDWKWQCGECGKNFARKADLNGHLKKHTREQPYVCRFCGEKYGYKISLRKHLSSKHGNEKGVEGEIENVGNKEMGRKTPVMKNTRKLVLQKKREIWLPSVPKVKLDRNRALRKVKGNEGEGEEKFKCAACRDGFYLNKELWVHQKEVHEEKVCIECGKRFSRNDHLNLHLEYHKDPSERKFECNICGKKCVAKYKLKEHMTRHAKNRKAEVKVKKKEKVKQESDQCELNNVRKISTKDAKLSGVETRENRYGLRKNCVTFYLPMDEIVREDEGDGFNQKCVDEENCGNENTCELVDDKYKEDFTTGIEIAGRTAISINDPIEAVEVISGNNMEISNAKDDILIQVEKVSGTKDKDGAEERSLKALGKDNLWTRKGTCFGDGTLVEFEDLD